MGHANVMIVHVSREHVRSLLSCLCSTSLAEAMKGVRRIFGALGWELAQLEVPRLGMLGRPLGLVGYHLPGDDQAAFCGCTSLRLLWVTATLGLEPLSVSFSSLTCTWV